MPIAETGADALSGLLTALPPWLQLLILGALLVMAVVFGKRRGRSKQSRSGSAPLGSGIVKDRVSPGRSGPTATRDLGAAEIRTLRPSYAPQVDGLPDPGEIVWTWVPYVEHDGRGKDRPVLIIARIDEESFAGCALSTKQHRDFVSVGRGAWDSQGRESFLSPERVLRVHARGMRREGQVLPKDRFVRAVAAIVERHGIAR